MSAFDYDKIVRYVDQEMTADERHAFEKEMELDASLRKEVELCRDVQDTLQLNLYPDESEQALRKNLIQIQHEYNKPGAKVISINKYRSWFAIAAAAMVVTALFMWQPWKSDLYGEFVNTRMVGVAERGSAVDSLLQIVTVKFNDKNFEQAISNFETLLKQQPDNAYVQFYYAVSLLQANHITESRKQLLMLYNGNSLFQYDAAFYLALSYLKEKDIATCKKWLHNIPADVAPYSKAQALLKKLG